MGKVLRFAVNPGGRSINNPLYAVANCSIEHVQAARCIDAKVRDRIFQGLRYFELGRLMRN